MQIRSKPDKSTTQLPQNERSRPSVRDRHTDTVRSTHLCVGFDHALDVIHIEPVAILELHMAQRVLHAQPFRDAVVGRVVWSLADHVVTRLAERCVDGEDRLGAAGSDDHVVGGKPVVELRNFVLEFRQACCGLHPHRTWVRTGVWGGTAWYRRPAWHPAPSTKGE